MGNSSRFDATNARRVALVAATCLVGLAVLELALAAGLRWGQIAFNHAHTGDLSSRERLIVGVLGFLHLPAALLVLGRAGYTASNIPRRVFTIGVPIVGVYETWAGLGVFSAKSWQHALGTVLALVVAFLCGVVVRSPNAIREQQG
jgi:hypothetical protein